jgi:hypothetical protein
LSRLSRTKLLRDAAETMRPSLGVTIALLERDAFG